MKLSLISVGIVSLVSISAPACDDDNDTSERDASMDPAGQGEGGAGGKCAADNGSLELPAGFCASVFADDVGKARHITVTPSGDVFVAIAADSGGVLALRDADGDGVAERLETFGDRGGNGILWRNGKLYFAENGRILRYDLPDGTLVPDGDADVVVDDLPDRGDHPAKAIAFDSEGRLIVNIASASNACQEDNRALRSEGLDPCPELEVRAGLWRFDANEEGQTQDDGKRIVTGVRNATALTFNEETGDVWALNNGRDQLNENWPDLFSAADDAALPGEEMWPVNEGDDHGWPYCYFDPEAGKMLLAPEYGGDGSEVGRCSEATAPATALPAHWAPLGVHFYRGELFPSRYRNGAFVASHGSRFAPNAQGALPGYNVVFLPWEDGALGERESFAEGFAGSGRPLPDKAVHRPVGLAEDAEGALYITDDHGGRIWKVRYAP